MTTAPEILDETELKSTVLCNQRSYEVPLDVALELTRLRNEYARLKAFADVALSRVLGQSRLVTPSCLALRDIADTLRAGGAQ